MGRPPTHGCSKLPEYASWNKAKHRCYNPKNVAFDRYGGAGIFMHPDWRDDFLAFYRYMGAKPTPRHTLDRIDNEKGYEPGNVRWATPKEQSSNRPTWVNLISFEGETHTLTDWALRVGLSRWTLRDRIAKWGVERAITTPKLNGHGEAVL